jgi:AcrR family transcriptional regulator
MTVSDPLPLRADARRNLERILVAARAAFAERGLDVGVEEIARRAGVGKATFFRRFPSKDALVLAVFEGFVADIEVSAQRCATAADPLDGIRDFLRENARLMAENAGFFDAMSQRHEMGVLPPVALTDRMMAALTVVLEPARRAGSVRPGIEPGDLSTCMKMLGTAIRPMRGVQLPEATWSRYLELLLDGLRAGQDALPGDPMDPCAMARDAIAKSA